MSASIASVESEQAEEREHSERRVCGTLFVESETTPTSVNTTVTGVAGSVGDPDPPWVVLIAAHPRGH